MEKFFEKYIDTIRIVIGILCVVAFILWGIFGSDKESKPSYEELEQEVDMLQQEVYELEDEIEELEFQIEVLEEENVSYQNQIFEYDLY